MSHYSLDSEADLHNASFFQTWVRAFTPTKNRKKRYPKNTPHSSSAIISQNSKEYTEGNEGATPESQRMPPPEYNVKMQRLFKAPSNATTKQSGPDSRSPTPARVVGFEELAVSIPTPVQTAGTGGIEPEQRMQLQQMASFIEKETPAPRMRVIVEAKNEMGLEYGLKDGIEDLKIEIVSEENIPSQQPSSTLKPRQKHKRPEVKSKHRNMKRPKRKRERMPSTYFIQSPLRRASEYTLSPRQTTLLFGYSMITICTVMFIFEMYLADWEFASISLNPTLGPTHDVLLKAGAKETSKIVDEGETWRIFTPMFLHSGLVHLVFNMTGLWYLVREMERTHGWQRLTVIYLLSGIFGTLCSAIFVPYQLMVGASGAIFGMVGARWADLIQNWSVLHKPWVELSFLFFLTASNYVFGFMPYLDNFAHTGGMVFGVLCGLVLLAQTRVDHFGFARGRKCYQTALATLAAMGTAALLMAATAWLYSSADVYAICPRCSKLSCVEFPPGAGPDGYWWDCSVCASSGFGYTQYTNGTFFMRCPREGGTLTEHLNITGANELNILSSDFYLDYCKTNC
mmetsp:Transcript_39324/g.64430  ORF Transcript_39324/g.64430 Transcript_39324/m.64430 type:complete len:569 (+) Transcript_39324:107-1813(+)